MASGYRGHGGVAHAHLTGYRRVASGRVAVTAACDPRADVLDAFCDEYNIPHRFSDLHALLASGTVDVVVDLTPPSARDDVVWPVLESGTPLLVEKPFAGNARRAAEYVEAARSTSTPLAVSQNFRWFPEHQWLKRQLDDARLGEVRYLEHRCFQNRRQRPDVWRAGERRLEMAIFSIHLIDRLQWLAGVDPVSVSAVTRRDPAGDLPGEQFTTMTVQFDGGVVAHMTSNWMSRALPRNDMRVDLDHGSVSVSREGPMRGDAVGEIAAEGAEPRNTRFPDSADDPHGPRTYGHSLLEFVEALDEGREPPHSGRDNLKTMGIMDAAYLSADRAGALVPLAEVLDGSAAT